MAAASLQHCREIKKRMCYVIVSMSKLRMQKLDFGAHVLQGTPPPGRGEATHLTVDIERCTAALPSCLAIIADHILFFVAPRGKYNELSSCFTVKGVLKHSNRRHFQNSAFMVQLRCGCTCSFAVIMPLPPTTDPFCGCQSTTGAQKSPVGALRTGLSRMVAKQI